MIEIKFKELKFKSDQLNTTCRLGDRWYNELVGKEGQSLKLINVKNTEARVGKLLFVHKCLYFLSPTVLIEQNHAFDNFTALKNEMGSIYEEFDIYKEITHIGFEVV